MKPFKIVKLILQICSITLFLGSFLVGGIDTESADNAAFINLLLASLSGIFVFAAVGTFLLNAPADAAKRIGHGLTISSYVLGLGVAFSYLENASAAIMMLVAAILLLLYYLCALIVKIMQKSFSEAESPNDDIRIVRVKEWKRIMEDGIISREEYEAKRCQILGIKPKAEKETEDKTAGKART